MNVLFPNFTFEDELTGRTRWSSATRDAVRDLAFPFGLLGRAGDTVLTSETIDAAALPECLQQIRFIDRTEEIPERSDRLMPWGWTKAAAELATGPHFNQQTVPSIDVVRNLNSRSFSAKFDPVDCSRSTELPFGTKAFGCLCHDMTTLQAAMAHIEACGFSQWLAKPALSCAGRNRLVGGGSALNEQQSHWLEKQFSSGVYIEPLVERIADAGLQFEIGSSSDPESITFAGLTGLLTDRAGHHVGSLLRGDRRLPEEWRAAAEFGRSVCRAAADSGYAGPLGIDAFQFRTPDGSTATRLCCDVNARYTMGRVAMELHPCLSVGQTGLWMQTSGGRFSTFLRSMRKTIRQKPFEDVDAVVTSPENVNGRSVTIGTVLLTSGHQERLIRLAEQLLPALRRGSRPPQE